MGPRFRHLQLGVSLLLGSFRCAVVVVALWEVVFFFPFQSLCLTALWPCEPPCQVVPITNRAQLDFHHRPSVALGGGEVRGGEHRERKEMATYFTLNTGARIPSVGLGTYKAGPGVVGDAIATAVKVLSPPRHTS